MGAINARISSQCEWKSHMSTLQQERMFLLSFDHFSTWIYLSAQQVYTYKSIPTPLICFCHTVNDLGGVIITASFECYIFLPKPNAHSIRTEER